MNQTSIELIIGFVTFVSSVCVSAFVSGMHWGEIKGDVSSIKDRLSKIEGMFTLRLRDSDRAD